MSTDKKNRIFINFSNHPSVGWGKEQMTQAKRYGEVVDLPFPQVDPLMPSEQVQSLADECVKAILDLGDPVIMTVHVMGEMTLVFHVVTSLQKQGVHCVASTTERIATETDFTKLSEFRFVTFRDY